MGYFPFFMDITGKSGVIAGGGRVAARKGEKLLAFGPHLTVIAPRIEECMRVQEKLLHKDAAVSLIICEREFRMEDLAGADFVIAATDDEALNGRISEYCMAEHIPVNVVDDREKCSFFFPAFVKEGNLTVGISTDGKSPLAASWVREEISRILPDGIGDVVDLMGQVRPYVMELEVQEGIRKEILEKMFLYCLERNEKVTLQELLDQFIGMKETGKSI
ncbi:MAG: bifunctional precorrin-2 dehydrogenase/sirohydrochlorin ferrochelatase [Lachnospiraceae bacterium]|nr:bifunctional precorrin-2 dehydrogenase/sirohydrochlorin ferrochelatase [Lachnospiraceae bacterium]